MRHITRKHVGCLAALGLVLIVVGVGITAVSRIRDAAAQSSCHNNFKQIGISAADYSDTTGHLPPGTFPNHDLPPERRLSWLFAIVPYIESTPVYKQVDKSAAWDAPQSREFVGVKFRPYQCPILPAAYQHPITTYTGVTGVGADSPTLPADHPRAGIFGYDRKTPKDAIKDGASNTIMLMEYGRDPVPWAKGGEGTLAWFADPPHAGPGRPFGTPHRTGAFVSFRKQFCGFVGFADCSVRTFRDTVSPDVLEALATIAGGESVVIPE